MDLHKKSGCYFDFCHYDVMQGVRSHLRWSDWLLTLILLFLFKKMIIDFMWDLKIFLLCLSRHHWGLKVKNIFLNLGHLFCGDGESVLVCFSYCRSRWLFLSDYLVPFVCVYYACLLSVGFCQSVWTALSLCLLCYVYVPVHVCGSTIFRCFEFLKYYNPSWGDVKYVM